MAGPLPPTQEGWHCVPLVPLPRVLIPPLGVHGPGTTLGDETYAVDRGILDDG